MLLDLFQTLFFAAGGAAVGSFVGAVIERQSGLPGRYKKKASGLVNRSFCFHCGHQLEWWENIPILSYLLLKGRCSHCHSPIPYWLPLIEVAGAAVGVVLSFSIGQIGPIGLIGLMVVSVSFLWIFFSDLVYGVVPDLAVILGAFEALVSHLSDLGNLSYLLNFFSSALGAAAFFGLLVLVTRGRGMGTGDVTLGALVGLLLGWPGVAVALWLAFVSGALVGVLLIAMKKKTLKQTVPFGPFLVAATAVTPLVSPFLDKLLIFGVK